MRIKDFKLRGNSHSRHIGPASWSKWRWALLPPYLLGYLFTYSIVGGGASYLAFTLISAMSCAVLLTRMNRPLTYTIPIWAILFVFLVGYYAKFYWAVLDIDGFMEAGQISVATYSSASLLPAFRLTTISFTGFCLAGWISLGSGKKRASLGRIEINRNAFRTVVGRLIWIIPIIMVFTFIVAYVTGITIMGAAPVALPFRLAGLIFYTRTVLIPALLLLLIFSGSRGGKRFHSRLGIILLILHGFSDVILRSSRGQLIIPIMALFFLFIMGGQRISQFERVVIVGGIILTIMLAPLITEYRNYRIITHSKNIGEAITWSLQGGFSGKAGTVETFTNGFKFVLLRITGIEMLMRYTSLGVRPLGVGALQILRSPRGLAGYVTVDLLGVPVEANTSAAVSLPGWFYLIGGTGFMAMGVALFVFLIALLWKELKKLRLRTLPVAQALFLLWTYSVTVEGTLDTQVISFLSMIASIIVCEWLVRHYEKQAKGLRTI
jgi:hypothetical protein